MNYFSKIFICILMAAAHTLDLSAGQPFKNHFQRQEADREWTRIYQMNPAVLPLYSAPYTSMIGADGSYEQGSLHHPQTSGQMMKVQFNTGSFVRFEDTGWTLHGAFQYENGVEKDGSSLLSYHLRTNGTPSYFYCLKPAERWGTRKYRLEATATKEFGTRWTAGLMFHYDGQQHFRSNDVRNDQTDLYMDMALGTAFRATPHSWFSLAATYSRNKEKPEFSNLYSSGAEYGVYLINGLGSYLKNAGSDIAWTEHLPGALIQWEMDHPCWQSSLSYQFNYGNNFWETMYQQAEKTENKLTGYRFTQHQVRLLEKYPYGKTIWSLLATFNKTAGSGKNWDKTQENYIDNYRFRGMDAGMELGWNNHQDETGQVIFRTARLALTYHSDRRLDRSFDYRLFHSSLDFGLQAGADWQIRKVCLAAQLEGAFSLPFKVRHTSKAAQSTNNYYYHHIGMSLTDWYLCRNAQTGLTFLAEFPVSQQKMEIGANALLIMNIGSTSTTDGGMTASPLYTHQHYLASRLFVNFYF